MMATTQPWEEMMAPRYVKTGKEGHEYLSWMLTGSDSPGILGSTLAGVLDLHDGEVVALIPQPTKLIDYHALRWGGGFADHERSLEWLVRDAQEYLAGGRSRCMVSVDYFSSSDHIGGGACSCPLVHTDREPLRVCSLKNSSTLRGMIDWCNQHLCFIAVLSSHPLAERWQHGSTISTNDVVTLAEGAKAIIVSAFDEESFIMWHPLDPK